MGWYKKKWINNNNKNKKTKKNLKLKKKIYTYIYTFFFSGGWRCVCRRPIKRYFRCCCCLVVWLLLLIIPYTVGQKKVTDDVYIPRRRRSLPKCCTAPEPLETRKITTKRSSFTYRSGITTTYTWNNHFFARMTMAYAVALITGGHQRESIFKHWTRLKFTNKSMTIEKNLASVGLK